MPKTKEQIQQDLLERFGIEIEVDKCETYNKAYGFLTSTATLATVKIVNEDKLKTVVGDRETFYKELSENSPKIKDKIIKRFYFKNVHIISPIMSETGDIEKGKAIQRLANLFGLNFLESYIEEFADKSLEEFKKMGQYEFIQYLFENSKMHCFNVSNAIKTRKMIKNIPYKFRDDFSECFFVDLNGNELSLRNNLEEDIFLNKLSRAGVYITDIDDSLPAITDIAALEEIIKEYDKYSDKIKIVFGEKSEFTGHLLNQDLKTAKVQREKCIEYINKQLSLVDLMDSFDINEELSIDDFDIGEDLPKENNDVNVEYNGIMDIPNTSDDVKNEDPNLQNENNDLDEDVEKSITQINGIDIQKDKEIIEKMIRETYIRKGKDVVTILACQYVQNNKQNSTINMTLENENYTFEGENKILKVLNAKYIEYILKNAKDIEYNFDMDPKSRRLGEAVIAMYSNMKSLNMEDAEIMDKLNEALVELTLTGKKDKFIFDCDNRNIVNVANGHSITQEESNYKVGELKYLQPYDIISTIVSCEIDNLYKEESINANREGRAIGIEKSDLETRTDTYTRMCNNMAISIDRRANVVNIGDKSTSRANIQASKTQLLMNILKDEKIREELDIARSTPTWEQLKKAEEYIEHKTADFFELTEEIRIMRGKIIQEKMRSSHNDEEKTVLEGIIKSDEEKLNQLLNKYNEAIKLEEKRKDITTYTSLQKALRAIEPNKRNRNEVENEH